MRILFDFEFIGDIELDTKIAEILMDAKQNLIDLFKDFETEMDEKNCFIIFSWKKDFATIIVSAPDELASRMYEKYEDKNFYYSLVNKYKNKKLN